MYCEYIPGDRSWQGVPVIRIGCNCDGVMAMVEEGDKDDGRTTGYQPVDEAVREWNIMQEDPIPT
jgi:hypothetical protein